MREHAESVQRLELVKPLVAPDYPDDEDQVVQNAR
jgi:hypothetical protein